MNPYRIWRRQLTEIQDKIQEYDENFDYGVEDLTDYWANRKPLTDELEAHYAKESAAVDATQRLSS